MRLIREQIEVKDLCEELGAGITVGLTQTGAMVTNHLWSFHNATLCRAVYSVRGGTILSNRVGDPPC